MLADAHWMKLEPLIETCRPQHSAWRPTMNWPASSLTIAVPGSRPCRLDGAPERSFGGDAHRIGTDLQVGNAEPLKMRVPYRPIREVSLRLACQLLDERRGQAPLTHVGQGLGVDHVIRMVSPHQLKKVQPAFAGRGAEPGKVVVADLRAGAVRGLVAGPGVIDRDPGRLRQPGAQHIASLITKALLALDEQTHDLPRGNRQADSPQLRH